MGQGPFPHAIYQVARYETLQSPQHLRWVGEGQVYYISVFQARTWVLSVFFETEHQGIGTHRSLGGVSCDLNPAAPGLLAKLQLCYSQFRRGHHHFPPHFVHTQQSQLCGSLTLIGLAPSFKADNGVSHLRLLLINEFLKYLYRPSLGPKYWLRKDDQ